MNKMVKTLVKFTLAGGALAAALTGCCLFGSDKDCCRTCGKKADACCCAKGHAEKPNAGTNQNRQGLNASMSIGAGAIR